jgi:uncharacterized protein (DUF433 family)
VLPPTTFRFYRSGPTGTAREGHECAQSKPGYHEDEGVKMANGHTHSEIDWMACELIEAVPGKVSGRPIVRGTRILPDAIVGSYELGETIDELREGFPSLSAAQIERLIEFAQASTQARAESRPCN